MATLTPQQWLIRTIRAMGRTATQGQFVQRGQGFGTGRVDKANGAAQEWEIDTLRLEDPNA